MFNNNYKINITDYDDENKINNINRLFFYYNSLYILCFIFLYLCCTLLVSFTIGDNECCRCTCCSCCDCCDCCNCCSQGGGVPNCDCNCNNCSDNCGSCLICCLIFIFIIVIIYYSTKLCGKRVSRYISLSFISFINLVIFFISLISIDCDINDNSNIIFGLYISLFLCISNFLGLVLPNFEKCKNLRYQIRPINYPQVYNLHQTNKNVVINQNYNNMNLPSGINYVVPIINNEYGYGYTGFPQEQRNVQVEINQPNVDSSNSSNNQSLNNGDIAAPPLPEQELPSEKEIYSSSSEAKL